VENMARIISIVCLCVLTLTGYAQTDSNYIKFNAQYFKSILLDTKDVLIFPAHMDSKDAFKASSALVVGASTFLVDKKWALFTQAHQQPDLKNVSVYALEPFGRGLYSVPLLIGFWAHGALAHNVHSNRIAMLGIKAFLISGQFAQLPKLALQRERPQSTINQNYNPFLFHPFSSKQKHHSFYSGHTTTAFAIAGIIAQEYRHKWWVGLLSYTMASGVALSRNYENKHWLSDVAIGALTGYGVAQLIYHRNNHKQKTKFVQIRN
jgi:membrane-associated phospholipid phosphatase